MHSLRRRGLASVLAAGITAVLLAAPLWVPALAAPLALLGLACRGPTGAGLGLRLGVVVLGYTLAFCIVGRPDNDYWGLMIAPLWPLGLIQADRVVAGLLSAAAGTVAGSSHRERRLAS